MANIEIDKKSGFCFGVVNAITRAEQELAKGGTLYCLGDIVHNGQEVERLSKLGLITINHKEYAELHNAKVLLRAHGEPPSTYEIARKNNLTLIDASCPVVHKLQSRIKSTYQNTNPNDNQIVIYGKIGHAEVIGLVGQTKESAIVIENENDIEKIDFSKKIQLFSQTTKSLEGFNDLVKNLSNKIQKKENFQYYDTICRQVANRIPNITNFAQQKDIIVFVSGKKSSNGRILFEHCKQINIDTYLVSSAEEVENLDIDFTRSIGICGATSTPTWLMEKVAEKLREQAEKQEAKTE